LRSACRLCDPRATHDLHAYGTRGRFVVWTYHFSDVGVVMGLVDRNTPGSVGGTFPWLLVVVWCGSDHPAGVGWAHGQNALVSRVDPHTMGNHAWVDPAFTCHISANLACFTACQCNRHSNGGFAGRPAHAAGDISISGFPVATCAFSAASL